MEKTLREKQKQEALKRMKMLKMDKVLIDALKDENTIFYSENLGAPMDAIWYSLGEINSDTDNYKKFMALAKELEEKYDAFAYHGQLTHADEDAYILLYVSADEDEWELDRMDLTLQRNPGGSQEYCTPIVYGSAGQFTEFGSVVLRPSLGGVCRVQ